MFHEAADFSKDAGWKLAINESSHGMSSVCAIHPGVGQSVGLPDTHGQCAVGGWHPVQRYTTVWLDGAFR